MAAPATLHELPEVHVDEAYVADPVPVAEKLRDVHPIARSARGVEVLTYEGCESAWHDSRFLHGIRRSLARAGLDPADLSGGGRTLLFAEGSDHAQLRRIVSRWFTPRQVDRLRDRVRGLVGSLVEPFTEAGGGDFMAHVARRIPGPVFCWMVGAPPERGDRLYAISEVMLRVFSGDPAVADEVTRASAEMRGFIDELVAEKRARPGEDLVSVLLAAERQGDITELDVHSLAMEMLGASTDNTANSAALAVHLLASHPDQWKRLVAEPGLAPQAAEECARLEPRVRFANVWAPEPTTLFGVDVPADTEAWLVLVAANRDPAVYPDPHRMDVARRHAKPQLNFGTGRHYCLGAALARMELSVLLEVLAERWTSLELAGEPDIRRDESTQVHSLPLACRG